MADGPGPPDDSLNNSFIVVVMESQASTNHDDGSSESEDSGVGQNPTLAGLLGGLLVNRPHSREPSSVNSGPSQQERAPTNSSLNPASEGSEPKVLGDNTNTEDHEAMGLLAQPEGVTANTQGQAHLGFKPVAASRREKSSQSAGKPKPDLTNASQQTDMPSRDLKSLSSIDLGSGSEAMSPQSAGGTIKSPPGYPSLGARLRRPDTPSSRPCKPRYQLGSKNLDLMVDQVKAEGLSPQQPGTVSGIPVVEQPEARNEEPLLAPSPGTRNAEDEWLSKDHWDKIRANEALMVHLLQKRFTAQLKALKTPMADATQWASDPLRASAGNPQDLLSCPSSSSSSDSEDESTAFKARKVWNANSYPKPKLSGRPEESEEDSEVDSHTWRLRLRPSELQGISHLTTTQVIYISKLVAKKTVGKSFEDIWAGLRQARKAALMHTHEEADYEHQFEITPYELELLGLIHDMSPMDLEALALLITNQGPAIGARTAKKLYAYHAKKLGTLVNKRDYGRDLRDRFCTLEEMYQGPFEQPKVRPALVDDLGKIVLGMFDVAQDEVDLSLVAIDSLAKQQRELDHAIDSDFFQESLHAASEEVHRRLNIARAIMAPEVEPTGMVWLRASGLAIKAAQQLGKRRINNSIFRSTKNAWQCQLKALGGLCLSYAREGTLPDWDLLARLWYDARQSASMPPDKYTSFVQVYVDALIALDPEQAADVSKHEIYTAATSQEQEKQQAGSIMTLDKENIPEGAEEVEKDLTSTLVHLAQTLGPAKDWNLLPGEPEVKQVFETLAIMKKTIESTIGFIREVAYISDSLSSRDFTPESLSRRLAHETKIIKEEFERLSLNALMLAEKGLVDSLPGTHSLHYDYDSDY